MECKRCSKEYELDTTDIHFDSGYCEVCEVVDLDGNIYNAKKAFEKKRLKDEWLKDAVKRVNEIRLPKVPKKGDKK